MEKDNSSCEARLLRQAEADRDAFFENSGIGICCIDAAGIVIRANATQLAILGYARHEYIGRPVADFFDDPAVARVILRCVQDGDKAVKRAARMRCKDGSVKAVTVGADGLWHGDALVHSRLYITDASERQQVPEMMEMTERRFRDAVNNFPDVFAIYDAQRSFLYVNEAGLAKNGLTLERMIGKRDEELFPPEFTRAYLPALHKAYETGAAQAVEASVTL